jgi:predicted ATPase
LRLGAAVEFGAVMYFRGDFNKALEQITGSMIQQSPPAQLERAILHGQDFYVSAQARTALALWFLGYTDRAVAKSQAAVDMAEKLAHPFSLAYARSFAAVLNQLRRLPAAVLEEAEATINLSKKHGLSLWEYAGMVLHGWAIAQQGDASGIEQIREGLSLWRETGANLTLPYFLTLLAESYLLAGRIPEALATLKEAAFMVARFGEHTFDAEMWRVEGRAYLQQALLAPDSSSMVHAEKCFQTAITIARQQSAKSMELRCAYSLCDLWKRRGKRREARDILNGISGWFTEGLDSIDFLSAVSLLKELG